MPTAFLSIRSNYAKQHVASQRVSLNERNRPILRAKRGTQLVKPLAGRLRQGRH